MFSMSSGGLQLPGGLRIRDWIVPKKKVNMMTPNDILYTFRPGKM